MFSKELKIKKSKVLVYRLKIIGAIFYFFLVADFSLANTALINVTGIVIDKETLNPISDAVIEVVDKNFFTTTRKDGTFNLENISEGNYQLKISHISYHQDFIRLVVAEKSDKSIIIYLTPKTIDISDVIVTDHYNEVSKFDEISEYTNVLKGKELQKDLGLTLASTLKNETGLAIRSMGPAPSRPVIRGLGQDRVFISEDGNKTSDLSATSPDHAVTIEPFTVNRIEVIRGPKVLLKTSTTIGGVVNVVRNEIPSEIEQHLHFLAGTYYESVNDGYLGSITAEIPIDPFALRFEISKRKSDDVKSPVGILSNSYSENLNYSFGGSYIGDFGFIGASFRRFELDYGIPGGFIGAHPNGVDISLFRRQAHIQSKLNINSDFIKEIEFTFGNSLYRHKEFESSGRIGSEFRIINNSGYINLNHNKISFIDNGIIGISFDHRDFDIGGYVFTPPTNSLNISAYLFETFRIGKFSFEFGSRMNIDNVVPENEILNSDIGDIKEKHFNTYSLSFSSLYELTKYVLIGANISKSSRVPTIEELFSQGPHLAAYSYEIGNPNLKPESGIGTEIFVFHKFENIIFNLNLFYNDLNSYIIPRNTGEINYQTFLPIYATYGVSAKFLGAELQFDWKICEEFSINLNSSYTKADFKNSDLPLPQIPPLKGLIEFRYSNDNLSTGLSTEIANAQNRVDIFETTTKGYVVNNFFIQYMLVTGDWIHNLSLNIDNIFNVKYFNHLSRIKSILPEAGRNLRISYKIYL